MVHTVRCIRSLGLFVILGLSSAALADDKSSGCGPGWYVTKQTTFSATTTRGTTNSYITPFAMSSGTSGCAKHTIAMNGPTLEFLDSNREILALEAAQGQGEYLEAFAASMGCDAQAFGVFASMVRERYDELFAADWQAAGLYEKTKTIVSQNPRLASCSLGA